MRCPFKIELTFGGGAKIEEVTDDAGTCPMPHFEVKPLSEIETAEEQAKMMTPMDDHGYWSTNGTWLSTYDYSDYSYGVVHGVTPNHPKTISFD